MKTGLTIIKTCGLPYSKYSKNIPNKRLRAICCISIYLLFCVLQNPVYAAGHKLVDELSHEQSQQKRFSLDFDRPRLQLRINGSMDIGILQEFERMLEKHPQLREVAFNSSGGNVYQARGLAKLIIARKLDTYVSGECYSACTIAYLAGTNRYMGPEGKLGFHQYRMKSRMLNPHFDVEIEQDRDISYFRSRIPANTFVERIFESRNNDLWIPEQQDLLATGVVHEVFPEPGR